MALPLQHWGSTPAERRAGLPADDLVPHARVATRAIDLACRPEAAFGWLTQMGFGRAGWYSYDWLDNVGRPSAREIRPDWQVTEAGDRIPGGPIDFEVTHLDEPSTFVLAVLGRRLAGHRIDFVLGFHLRPSGPAGTRLVSRARIAITGPLGRPATAALTIGDGIMVRRQLLGLRDRCR